MHIAAIARYKHHAFLTFALALLLVGSSPTFADCVDADGDGYGAPADPMCSAGSEADCDDTDASINPGAQELCGGGDENCDGQVDENFGVGESCGVPNTDPDTGATCYTAGSLACSADGLSSICQLDIVDGVTPELDTPSPEAVEGPSDPTCFDTDDNDCDGLVDHAEPECQGVELCNGFDDDFNGAIDDGFPGLGDACSVGTGACFDSGVRICAPDAMGLACSATAGVPQTEDLSADDACFDDIDNDCDGLVDFEEEDCRTTELCDGRDNDGDGDVDEGFGSVGDVCTDGVGACAVDGIQVCSADGTQSICDSTPGMPVGEGPTGVTCHDGIDNDCDGLTDSDDANCDSALIAVQCALPYTNGAQGNDCTGWHRVEYTTAGFGEDAVVTAELLALDSDGTVLESIEVEQGDRVHMASREQVRLTSNGNRHTNFSPIPMLRVTIQEGNSKSTAYCSSIPSLDILSPSENLPDVGPGGTLSVLAAIPLVDPRTLQVKIDGIDVLAMLGIDASIHLPGGPFEGTVSIGGRDVEISGLVVSAAPDISVPAANTLRMDLANLGGGGHIVVVEGDPDPSFPTDPASVCHVDDVRDVETASSFTVTIDSPQPESETTQVPTPVFGEVLHGRQIEAVRINGMELDTSDQEFIPGDGETTADTYRFVIDTALAQTDLAAELASGDPSQGAFDLGWNRLIANAVDVGGRQAFENLFFAVVPTEISNSVFPTSLKRAGYSSGISAIEQASADPVAEPTPTATIEETDIVVGINSSVVDALVKEQFERASIKELQPCVDKVCSVSQTLCDDNSDCSTGETCNPRAPGDDQNCVERAPTVRETILDPLQNPEAFCCEAGMCDDGASCKEDGDCSAGTCTKPEITDCADANKCSLAESIRFFRNPMNVAPWPGPFPPTCTIHPTFTLNDSTVDDTHDYQASASAVFAEGACCETAADETCERSCDRIDISLTLPELELDYDLDGYCKSSTVIPICSTPSFLINGGSQCKLCLFGTPNYATGQCGGCGDDECLNIVTDTITAEICYLEVGLHVEGNPKISNAPIAGFIEEKDFFEAPMCVDEVCTNNDDKCNSDSDCVFTKNLTIGEPTPPVVPFDDVSKRCSDGSLGDSGSACEQDSDCPLFQRCLKVSRQKIGCLAGFVVDVVRLFEPGEFASAGGTGNFADSSLAPAIEDNLTAAAFTSSIVGKTFPLPVPSQPIVVSATEDLSYTIEHKEVDITGDPDGALKMIYDATFAPVEPVAPALTALPLTPAPAPSAPLSGADNSFVMMSDDSFNEMLTALTASGVFTPEPECIQAGTVDTFLEVATQGDGCDSLIGTPVPLANAKLQGECHGLRQADCSTLTAMTESEIGAKQGACQRVRGGSAAACNIYLGFPTTPRKIAAYNSCQATPDYGVTETTPILACPVVNVPPRLLLAGQTNSIGLDDATLRFSDVQVGLYADRNETGTVDTAVPVPFCGDPQRDNPNGNDCRAVDLCLDLNIRADLQLDTGGDTPRIVTTVVEAREMNGPTSVVCQGGPLATIINAQGAGQFRQAITDAIAATLQQIEGEAPPLVLDNFDFNSGSGDGPLEIRNPRLLAVDTDGDPTFQDFFGLTFGTHPAPRPATSSVVTPDPRGGFDRQRGTEQKRGKGARVRAREMERRESPEH